MRESARTERMHLPADSTEVWLKLQKPTFSGTGRHRNPPGDSYEVWVKKRVEKATKRGKAAA